MVKDSAIPGSLIDMLKRKAAELPDQKAYIYLDADFNEDCVTYSRLLERVEKYAEYLYTIGVREKSCCMLLFKQSIDFIVAFFACGMLGAIPIPLNMPVKPKSLSKWEKIAEETGAGFALTMGKKYSGISKLFENSGVLSKVKILCENMETGADSGLKEGYSEIAFIQYTSGSTDFPKGIMVTHESVLNNMKQIQRILQVDEKTVMVMWLPYYHDMGLIGGILLSVLVGYPLIMLSPVNFMSDPMSWARTMTIYKATHTGAPNFAYVLLSDRLKKERDGSISFKTLKCAFCGSEPISAEAISDFGKTAKAYGMEGFDVFSGYGLAEGSLIASGYVRGREKMSYLVLDRNDLNNGKITMIKRGSIEDFQEADKSSEICLVGNGFVVDEHGIDIIDVDTKEILGPRRIGEIRFSGKSVTRGYWKKKIQTEQVFSTLDNGHRSVLTGDIGFLDENGELYVICRKKEVIILKGCNYYPQDIEKTVFEVNENFYKNGTAAFSVPDGDVGEKLAIAQEIKLSGMKNADCEKWAAQIRKAVAEEHNLQISKIIFLPKMHIPRTSSGKIRRLEAREKEISDHWEKVIGVSELKMDDEALSKRCVTLNDYINFAAVLVSGQLGIMCGELDYTRTFMEMGLNSMMFLSMREEIKKYLEVDIQAETLFRYNTVNEIGKYIYMLKNNIRNQEEFAEYKEEALDNMSYEDLLILLKDKIEG